MYEKALSYNASNIPVLNNYSYFLAMEGQDLDKAERMSAQTVKAEPDNATYLDTYAWIFFKQGNYSLARIYLQNALDKTKEPSAELFEHYGDILFMLGEVDEAVTYWQKALEALSLIHISEPTRQAEISYAVFCLKKKKKKTETTRQEEISNDVC